MPDRFPDPTVGGPRWAKYEQLRPDWKPLVATHTYEDGGISVLSKGDSPVYRWQIEYGGLFEIEADILDEHYDSAHHNELSFTFVDREGVAWTGVRYEAYERDHRLVSSQRRTVRLVKYP